MSKIRINDLARELEVKSKAILDALPEVGVTEKKTHSSSVEEHEAEKVRAYLRAASEAQTSAKHSRPIRVESDEIQTKIDLSNISRPGDVLNAIRKQQAPMSATAPSVRPAVSASPAAPSVSPVKAPPPPPTSAVVPGPRIVVPSSVPRPTFSRSSAGGCAASPIDGRTACGTNASPTCPCYNCAASGGASGGSSFRGTRAGHTSHTAAVCDSSNNETDGAGCAATAANAVAAHDRAPHRASSGVQGTARASCANRPSWGTCASGAWTSGPGPANFSASSSGQCRSSGSASSAASGRAAADASDAPVTHGHATARGWAEDCRRRVRLVREAVPVRPRVDRASAMFREASKKAR